MQIVFFVINVRQVPKKLLRVRRTGKLFCKCAQCRCPYADDSVKVLKFDGVEYSPQNIIDGKYPIYGYGHMYTKGEPTGAVKAFIDYILSDEFQNTQVEKLGFIPVSKMKK